MPESDNTQYIAYHVGLLQEFKALIEPQAPFSQPNECTEEDKTFIHTLTQLCQFDPYSEDANQQGQWLIGRIISAYSHLTPQLPRDLL